MSLACPVCLAAEFATDDSKERLLRYQAVKLEQARDALLPLQVELGRMRDREREYLETIDRLNKRVLAKQRRAS